MAASCTHVFVFLLYSYGPNVPDTHTHTLNQLNAVRVVVEIICVF